MLLRAVVALLALSSSVVAPLAETIFSGDHDCCAAPCPGDAGGDSGSDDDCRCCVLDAGAIVDVGVALVHAAPAPRASRWEPAPSPELPGFTGGIYRPPRG